MKDRDRLKEIRARLDGLSWVGDEFIAHAPVDIAWLLAEVEELRAVVRKTPAHYRADARAVRDGLRYDRV